MERERAVKPSLRAAGLHLERRRTGGSKNMPAPAMIGPTVGSSPRVSFS